MHQEATAGEAPNRRICWKLKVVEKTGPPGSVALSECAAYAVATCLRMLTLVPAPRSSARCIRAYVPIEATSARTRRATQPQCGARSWRSAPASAGQPRISSTPRIEHDDAGHDRARGATTAGPGRGADGFLNCGHRIDRCTSRSVWRWFSFDRARCFPRHFRRSRFSLA